MMSATSAFSPKQVLRFLSAFLLLWNAQSTTSNTATLSRRPDRADRTRVLFQSFNINLFPVCGRLTKKELDKLHRALQEAISATMQNEVKKIGQGLEFQYLVITDISVMKEDRCTTALEIGHGVVNFMAPQQNTPSKSQVYDLIRVAIRDNLVKTLQRSKDLDYITFAYLPDEDSQEDDQQRSSCDATIKRESTQDAPSVCLSSLTNKTALSCEAIG